MKEPYPYGQTGQSLAGNYSTVTIAAQQSAPPPSTRFSSAAGRLEAQLGHLNNLVERASHIADRLGGSVPEAVNKVAGARNSSCVASILEGYLDDFESLSERFRSILERLETL